NAPAGPAALERFLVEIRSLARLDHENIVRVLAVDVYRADPFFTMEYAPGGSLADRVAESGPLEPAEAARLVATVARAAAVPRGAARGDRAGPDRPAGPAAVAAARGSPGAGGGRPEVPGEEAGRPLPGCRGAGRRPGPVPGRAGGGRPAADPVAAAPPVD